MSVSFSIEKHHAFLLTPEQIKKLCELFSSDPSTVKIEAHCIDGIQFTENFEKLFAYENPKKKRINRLRIGDWPSTSIEFRDDFYLSPVDIRLRAADANKINQIRSNLFDVLDGTKPWYDFLTRWTTGYPILLGLYILFIYLPFIYGILDRNSKEAPLWFVTYSTLGGLVLILLLFWLRIRLFPKGVFLIGQEKDRYALMEKIRWGVIVSFIVSLVAGYLLL